MTGSTSAIWSSGTPANAAASRVGYRSPFRMSITLRPFLVVFFLVHRPARLTEFRPSTLVTRHQRSLEVHRVAAIARRDQVHADPPRCPRDVLHQLPVWAVFAVAAFVGLVV